jgi:K+-sensing histidine kinase KdpD
VVAGRLAYFISDVVDQLDLSAIESVYEDEERGHPPYHPRMMTKILQTAGLACVIIRGSLAKKSLPFLFLGVVILIAMRFGSAAGILGTLGAAMIFAEFFVRPSAQDPDSRFCRARTCALEAIVGLLFPSSWECDPKART